MNSLRLQIIIFIINSSVDYFVYFVNVEVLYVGYLCKK